MKELLCIIGCCFIGGFLAPIGEDLSEMYRDDISSRRFLETSNQRIAEQRSRRSNSDSSPSRNGVCERQATSSIND